MNGTIAGVVGGYRPERRRLGRSPATSPTSTSRVATRSCCTRSPATATTSPSTRRPERRQAGSQWYRVRVPPGASRDRQHREAAGERLFPVLAVVGVEHAGPFAGEQARRHHVVMVGELDDERGREVGEEVDDLVERDGVGEREVVDDGQAQHEIRPDALDERQALARPPAETRRRVGQVEHEGEHTSLAVAPEVAVETIDDEVVGVDGDDDAAPACECEAGEVAVVGAEVEHRARGDGASTAAATNRSLACRSWSA